MFQPGDTVNIDSLYRWHHARHCRGVDYVRIQGYHGWRVIEVKPLQVVVEKAGVRATVPVQFVSKAIIQAD
jgi:hypothetical protein